MPSRHDRPRTLAAAGHSPQQPTINGSPCSGRRSVPGRVALCAVALITLVMSVPSMAQAANAAPVIDSAAPTTATEDQSYSYNATRQDPDGPGQTWSLTDTHTCGGSITASGGQFSFTPDGPNPPSSCLLSIEVCDEANPSLCDTQTTTITINAVNDAPVIDSAAPTTATEDQSYSYDATRQDPDGPGQTWSLTDTHTCGGSITASGGQFTFTPDGPNPPSSCLLSIEVCDEANPSLCDTQTTTITINPVDGAQEPEDEEVPAAEPEAEGDPLPLTLFNPPDPVTIPAFTLPSFPPIGTTSSVPLPLARPFVRIRFGDAGPAGKLTGRTLTFDVRSVAGAGYAAGVVIHLGRVPNRRARVASVVRLAGQTGLIGADGRARITVRLTGSQLRSVRRRLSGGVSVRAAVRVAVRVGDEVVSAERSVALSD
jgi:hypothetical protein